MIISQEEFLEKSKDFPDWNIWQSWHWGKYQGLLGNKIFSVSWDSYLWLAVKLSLPFGQSLLQIPRWPLGNINDEFLDDVYAIAKQEGCTLIRLIPQKSIHLDISNYKSLSTNFPNTSLVIDLDKNEDDILKQMKQKWRYNIRLAQKKWVEVRQEKDSKKAAEIFGSLAKVTWNRDGFVWHNSSTYETMLENLEEKVLTLVAYKDDQPISAWIFTFCWGRATYYYWASSNEHRNLMAPYLIQWEAIVLSKSLWYKSYDFFWIAEDEDNSKDPLYGVTQFKMKFGWEKVSYPNAIDIPVSKFKYWMYRIVSWLRR